MYRENHKKTNNDNRTVLGIPGAVFLWKTNGKNWLT